MVRVISQEHFDATYTENREVFDLSPEEALEETVKQFTAQGVDLSNIVQRPYIPGAVDPVRDAVCNLQHCSTENCLECLEIFEKLLKSDKANRIASAKCGAYEVLLEKLELYNKNEALTCAILQTLTLLTNGYPDLLDERGLQFTVENLKKHDHTVSKCLFKWAANCCVLHEKNRQDFINAGIIDVIKFYINDETPTDTLQAACLLISTVTRDDDIRVQVSDAHRHACLLARELLLPLSKCLSAHLKDDVTASIIMKTVGNLVVRNEFCELMLKEGFLNVVKDCLFEFIDKEVLYVRAFVLLTALAGNDDVKNHIMEFGMGPLIASSMSHFCNSLGFCIAASNLVAALCLRQSQNSKALFDLGCGSLLMANMKIHMTSSKLQMISCRALRNMISYDPQISVGLKYNGIEEIVHEVMKMHDDCRDHGKDLLKQLGCKVHLDEPWTGKEGNKLK